MRPLYPSMLLKSKRHRKFRATHAAQAVIKHPHLKRAGVAQLVEQRIRNAWVRCSSHLSGTISLRRARSPYIGPDPVMPPQRPPWLTLR